MKVDELKELLSDTDAEILQVFEPTCKIKRNSNKVELAGPDDEDIFYLHLVWEGFTSEAAIRNKLGDKRFVAMDCGDAPSTVGYPQGRPGVRYAIPDEWNEHHETQLTVRMRCQEAVRRAKAGEEMSNMDIILLVCEVDYLSMIQNKVISDWYEAKAEFGRAVSGMRIKHDLEILRMRKKLAEIEFDNRTKTHIMLVQQCAKDLISAGSVPGGHISRDDYAELEKRVLNHDDSKFGEAERDAYTRYWHYLDDQGRKDPIEKEQFDEAWEHHYMHNDHHPEYWIARYKTPADMSIPALLEMICDWGAMSREKGTSLMDWVRQAVKKHQFGHHEDFVVYTAQSLA